MGGLRGHGFPALAVPLFRFTFEFSSGAANRHQNGQFMMNRTSLNRCDVAVVGAGIIGLMTALFLARKGLSVTIVESGRVGFEQSTRNWGWCRQVGRDVRELPLAYEAMRLWRKMDEIVGGDTGFRQCGIVYLAQDEDSVARYQQYLEMVPDPGNSVRILDRAAMARLVPGFAGECELALYSPADGRAEPRTAIARILRAVRRAGVKVVTNCRVEGLETSGGQTSALLTSHGRIDCSKIVVAAGKSSRKLLSKHGVDLPQATVVSSVFRTDRIDGGPATCVFGNGYALRRNDDGGYTIGHGSRSVLPMTPSNLSMLGRFSSGLLQERSFLKRYLIPTFDARVRAEWCSKLFPCSRKSSVKRRSQTTEPHAHPAIIEDALKNLRSSFPMFKKTKINSSWAGTMDFTPDGLPVISAVPAMSGLFVATGFCGHGFGIAPAAGNLAACLVAGDDPIVDPRHFRFTRFEDGTKPRPEQRF
jgi:glycine/D-amino acid oxidase-like deaminating enzyme